MEPELRHVIRQLFHLALRHAVNRVQARPRFRRPHGRPFDKGMCLSGIRHENPAARIRIRLHPSDMPPQILPDFPYEFPVSRLEVVIPYAAEPPQRIGGRLFIQ